MFAANSLIFVPGSRPDRFAKAQASGAGLTVIDLEDAVAAADKDTARAAALTQVAGGGSGWAFRCNGIATAAGIAAKRATGTIPVVVVSGDDPVAQGLVASINRPGGNVTAVSLFTGELIGKRLGFLFDVIPEARQVALLVNPNNPNAAPAAAAAIAAAQRARHECVVVNASTEGEIDATFATLAERAIKVLLTDSDPFLNSRHSRIVALANGSRCVANYPLREYVVAGGFSSYGVDFADSYRQAGTYAGKILIGTKPAELPVLQPTKFNLVVNLKAAAAVALNVPPSIRAAADEVIE